MRPTKIQVIDDSKLVHTMFSLMFRKIKQIHAFNGVEALDQLRAQRDVDLIFLDINMPEMNGLEFLRQIKADRFLCEIPVIIISTEGKEQDTVRGLESGAVAYVKKPFRTEAVIELVERVVPAVPAAMCAPRPVEKIAVSA
jgi:two-component system chemotaxis response regulator CheY